eukprot:GGOE01000097.1.p1 GENE.GGOE01000097.1~~GGOE01000097.1.p1  ORF type:complete len:1098 (+),score=248.36 GGOE01000097.1:95-3388(+)
MADSAPYAQSEPPAQHCHCQSLRADRWLLLQHILSSYPAVLLPAGCPLHALDLDGLDVRAMLRSVAEERLVDLSHLHRSSASAAVPLHAVSTRLAVGTPVAAPKLVAVSSPAMLVPFSMHAAVEDVPPALTCRLATYEAVLMASGLLSHADPQQLDAILSEVRHGLAISPEEHGVLLAQLIPHHPDAIPSSPDPHDVASHFAAPHHSDALRGLAQQAAAGYGYRWVLVHAAAARKPPYTDVAFLHRQCLHFAFCFGASLHAAGRVVWHVRDDEAFSTTQAEAALHDRLLDIWRGVPGALSEAQQLVHALAAQLPPHIADVAQLSPSVPEAGRRKARGAEKPPKARSGSLARLTACLSKKEPVPADRDTKHHRRFSFTGTTVVPLGECDGEPEGSLPYTLHYQPATGALYYRHILSACFPASTTTETRRGQLLQGLLQPRLRVTPAFHHILCLEGAVRSFGGDSSWWQQRAGAVEHGLMDIPDDSVLQPEERQLLRDTLRAVLGHLKPLLSAFHLHLAGRPQLCRAAVAVYCVAHRRLHNGDADGDASLATDLEDSLYCSGMAAYYAHRVSAERLQPITTLPQLQRLLQEEVLPFLWEQALPFASLVAAVGDTSGRGLPTAFVKCLVVDLLALLTTGKSQEAVTVSDSLLGLLRCLRAVVCEAHEAGHPVDFRAIASDVSMLNGVLGSVASAWQSQVEINFRQYFDHLVETENWDYNHPLARGQCFTSAVDLLHILDVNAPAVASLLMPQAPDLVLRYAQSIAAFMLEYARLVAQQGSGNVNDGDLDGDSTISLADRWLREGLPEKKRADAVDTPTAMKACQALNTLCWLRPNYHRLLNSLSGRETGDWADLTLQPVDMAEPLLRDLDNVVEKLTSRVVHHLGRHLVLAPPVGPLLLADLYSVVLKPQENRAALAVHSPQAVLQPGSHTSLDAVLRPLDSQLSAVRHALDSEAALAAVAVQVALQLSHGLLRILLAGGDSRVFSPQFGDALCGDLRSMVQFFCPYEDEGLRGVVAREVSTLRSIVDLMQLPTRDLLYGGLHGPGYDALDDSPRRLPLTRAVVRAILLHRKDPEARKFALRSLALTKLPAGLRLHVTGR